MNIIGVKKKRLALSMNKISLINKNSELKFKIIIKSRPTSLPKSPSNK